MVYPPDHGHIATTEDQGICETSCQPATEPGQRLSTTLWEDNHIEYDSLCHVWPIPARNLASLSQVSMVSCISKLCFTLTEVQRQNSGHQTGQDTLKRIALVIKMLSFMVLIKLSKISESKLRSLAGQILSMRLCCKQRTCPQPPMQRLTPASYGAHEGFHHCITIF